MIKLANRFRKKLKKTFENVFFNLHFFNFFLKSKVGLQKAESFFIASPKCLYNVNGYKT